jgi:hypothetical protein
LNPTSAGINVSRQIDPITAAIPATRITASSIPCCSIERWSASAGLSA